MVYNSVYDSFSKEMSYKVTAKRFQIPKQHRPQSYKIPTKTMKTLLESPDFPEKFRLGQVYGEYDYSDDPDMEDFKVLFGSVVPKPNKFIVFMTRPLGQIKMQVNVDFRVGDDNSALTNTHRYYFVTKGQATIFDYTGERHVLREGEMLYMPMLRCEYNVSITVKPHEGAFAKLDRDTQLVCFTAASVVGSSILSVIGNDLATVLVDNDQRSLKKVDQDNEHAMECQVVRRRKVQAKPPTLPQK